MARLERRLYPGYQSEKDARSPQYVTWRRILDWRHSEDYSFIGPPPPSDKRKRTALPGGVSPRWEFLRRNVEYRREWAEALRTFGAGVDVERLEPMQHPDAPWFVIRSEVCAERWFLTGYRDPAIDEMWATVWWADDRPRVFTPNPQDRTPPTLPDASDLTGDDLVVVFDLNLTLGPQIERVRKLEKSWRYLRKRYQDVAPARPALAIRLWPTYLRLLDALDEFGLADSVPTETDLDRIEEEAPDLALEDHKARLERVRSARALTTPHGQKKRPGYLTIPV